MIKYRGKCVKPTVCPLKYRLNGLPLRFYEGNWTRADRKKIHEIYEQLQITKTNESRRHRSKKLGMVIVFDSNQINLFNSIKV